VILLTRVERNPRGLVFFMKSQKGVRLWSVWTRSGRPRTLWETRSVRFPQVRRDPQAAAHQHGVGISSTVQEAAGATIAGAVDLQHPQDARPS
jgi:hypothetical protein